MPTLERLGRQIETATDLGSVVTTMKTLAAVSIHQYEQAVEALADYNRSIELGFQIALKQAPFHTEPPTHGGTTAAVVFGSDQGMCGQFNEEMVSFVDRIATDDQGAAGWRLLVAGVRAQNLLQDAGWTIDQLYRVPSSVSEIDDLVQDMFLSIQQLRMEADLSRLIIFYHCRTSAASYSVRQLQLLPIESDHIRRWRDEPWGSRSSPLFATDRRRLMSCLIRHYLYVAIFRACAESLASENASRITAMQAAEKNIEERLDELQTAFHHLRQTAITEELLDVVTGFEALAHGSATTGR